MADKHKKKKVSHGAHAIQPKGQRWYQRLVQKRLFWYVTAIVTAVGLVGAGLYLYPRYVGAASDLPAPPLKDLAVSDGIQLGTLVHADWLQRKPFEQILSSQFNLVTSDKELHWDKLRPTPNSYNFKPVDELVAYAQAHDMAVQGHHLVWNEDDSLPKWLKNGNYSQAQLYDLMHQHISTVVGHFKGKISEWTVVNEPFTRSVHTYGLDNWWGDHLGGGFDYIDQAFTWTHAADPQAKLILNDFNNETINPISDAQYAYMQAARTRHVPIDGIGMQMHLDASQPPSEAAMITNMQRFGKLGYKVYITEFDINAMTVKGSADYKKQLEARITADVVRACVESHDCVSLNIFGITDRKNVVSFTHPKNRDSLFTSTYAPKPAFYSFRNAWSSR